VTRVVRDAPLPETAILLLGLALLAWPLHRLTADPPAAAPADDPPAASATTVPCTLEVRAAHPFDSLVITRDGETWGELAGPAREGELGGELLVADELLVARVRFPEGTPTTAVRLSFWPEGLPTHERTLWGEGELVATLEPLLADE